MSFTLSSHRRKPNETFMSNYQLILDLDLLVEFNVNMQRDRMARADCIDRPNVRAVKYIKRKLSKRHDQLTDLFQSLVELQKDNRMVAFR